LKENNLSLKKQSIMRSLLLTIGFFVIAGAGIHGQIPEVETVVIPGGVFKMGQSVEGDETGFEVRLDTFRMSIYEITNEQYCVFLNEMKERSEDILLWINSEGNSVDDPNVLYFDWMTDTYKVEKGFEDHPVVYVSWQGAMAFAEWVGGCLPTEAQWEYACRAGTTTLFNTGSCLDGSEANYNAKKPLDGCPKGEFRNTAIKVGSFAPNPWGLYDMHGNVWEWCLDWHADYTPEAKENPAGPEAGKNKVRRGGSYLVNARSSFTAYRNITPPTSMFNDIGFRVVFQNE
jgi:formylglycine-generating enzyme